MGKGGEKGKGLEEEGWRIQRGMVKGRRGMEGRKGLTGSRLHP